MLAHFGYIVVGHYGQEGFWLVPGNNSEVTWLVQRPVTKEYTCRHLPIMTFLKSKCSCNLIIGKHLSSAAVRSQQYIVINIIDNLPLLPYAAPYRSVKELVVVAWDSIYHHRCRKLWPARHSPLRGVSLEGSESCLSLPQTTLHQTSLLQRPIAEIKTTEMRTRMKLYYYNSKRNIYTIIVIYI